MELPISSKRHGQSTSTTNYDGDTVDNDSGTEKLGGTGQPPGSVIKQKTDWKKRG
jgi:hypothetical protein